MNRIKNFLQKNLVKVAIWTVVVLILAGAGLSYYNRQIMRDALILKEQSNVALKEVDRVYQNIQLMDISSRGYALIRKPEYLFWTVEMSNQRSRDIFRNLDSLFTLQGYTNPKNYSEVKSGLDQYTKMFARMVGYLANNEDEKYIELLSKDEGRLFWAVYTPFVVEVTAHEAQINADSQEEYAEAVFRNGVIQILLLVIGLPTLILIGFTLAKDEKGRISLLLNLEKNNKEYLYDDGIKSNSEAKAILEASIENLQKAATFVNEISVGNYEARWDGLNEENASLNHNNLAGRLMYMRDEMNKVKEEDRKRIWATEGLSDFSEIIRKHQHDLTELTHRALDYLVKYLKSQQGSIFIVQVEDEKPSLNLAACYAFDRRKYINKKIASGEGLVGQAFLEAHTILLKNIPKNYVSITSGLGDATPSCLLIVPLKYNEEVQAVLEIATFKEYQPYQVSFLEKAGEFIASAIASAQNNQKNNLMMEQMRQQTEQLRSQEEEMRQNLEELEATQEEMRRKSLLMEEKV
jgi:CHASE3 domain sensor protein